MHYGTQMNVSQFGVKRSNVKVTVKYSMLELRWKHDVLIFTKLTSMMYYGTVMNSLNFGVKSLDNICWNRHCTRGGIQYSMSRVELDLSPVYSDTTQLNSTQLDVVEVSKATQLTTQLNSTSS